MQNHSNPPLRGVNLGGWLVVEKWMTPSLFEGTDASDQYSLVRTPGGLAKLQSHYDSFITENDFIWLKNHAINAVRVPIGFWALTDEPPLVNNQKQLDWLFAMAKKYDIAVLLCLHAADGSQNGHDHSGRIGDIKWYKWRKRNKTLQTLRTVATRYNDHPNLWGIELLNEPSVSNPLQYWQLLHWSRKATKQLRGQFPSLRIIYSDAFAPNLWSGKVRGIMDIHNYQTFSSEDIALDLKGHVQKLEAFRSNLKIWQRNQPIIIGEWSLGLHHDSLQGTPRDAAEKQFGQAQLQAYSQAAGWFFWSYKTEQNDGWNYRHLVEQGVLSTISDSAC